MDQHQCPSHLLSSLLANLEAKKMDQQRHVHSSANQPLALALCFPRIGKFLGKLRFRDGLQLPSDGLDANECNFDGNKLLLSSFGLLHHK